VASAQSRGDPPGLFFTTHLAMPATQAQNDKPTMTPDSNFIKSITTRPVGFMRLTQTPIRLQTAVKTHALTGFLSKFW
jgi:hypothetical protein